MAVVVSQIGLRKTSFAFKHFLASRCCLRTLSTNLSGLKSLHDAIYGYEVASDVLDIKFEPRRIRLASLGSVFSSAHVQLQVAPYLVDRDGRPYERKKTNKDIYIPPRTAWVCFDRLFADGFKLLHSLSNHLEENDNCKNWQYSEDDDVMRAVTSLSNFFIEYEKHDASLKKAYDMDEGCSFVPVLACHLIGKLCSGNYLVTNDGPMTEKYAYCPCSVECREKVKYGNTNLGHANLWFGHSDIVALPSGYKDGCQIAYVPDNPGYDLFNIDKNGQDSQIEVETSVQYPCEITKEQVIAQAITFSFCQSSTQEESPEKFKRVVSLIPTILMSNKQFRVYMYDYDYDILLESNSVDLFWKGDLNKVAIVQLWMLLHYYLLHPRFMKNELSELRGSAGFQSLPEVQGLVNEFKRNVTFVTPGQIKRFINENEFLGSPYGQKICEADEYDPVRYRSLT